MLLKPLSLITLLLAATEGQLSRDTTSHGPLSNSGESSITWTGRVEEGGELVSITGTVRILEPGPLTYASRHMLPKPLSVNASDPHMISSKYVISLTLAIILGSTAYRGADPRDQTRLFLGRAAHARSRAVGVTSAGRQ